NSRGWVSARPYPAARPRRPGCPCPDGGIGRRTSFRCWRSQGRGGSSPLLGTILLFAVIREQSRKQQNVREARVKIARVGARSRSVGPLRGLFSTGDLPPAPARSSSLRGQAGMPPGVIPLAGASRFGGGGSHPAGGVRPRSVRDEGSGGHSGIRSAPRV